MSVFITIPLFLLNFSNVVIHIFGSFLLLTLHKQEEEQNVEVLYILNLSICEAISNVLVISIDIPPHISSDTKPTSLANDIHNILIIVKSTGIILVYFLCMAYITADRLMYIVLNLKYPIYWNVSKAKSLLISTWTIGIVLILSIAFAYKIVGFEFQELFNIYFYPTLELAFMALALITYGFIFYRYKKARSPPACSSAPVYRQSVWNIFRSSRFFIALLLIASFLIFIVIPDLYLFIAAVSKKEKVRHLVICRIFFALSDTFDALIYIYLQKKVRKIMMEKLHLVNCLKERNRRKEDSVRTHVIRINLDNRKHSNSHDIENVHNKN